MTGPAYSSVVILHVLAAVVGFGALGATGAYAGALRRDPRRLGDVAFRRYFRPGRNWAAHAIAAVPVLGGVLLALGHRPDLTAAYPWIGLAIWAVAATLAEGVVWPAERRLQRIVAGSPVPGVDDVAAVAEAATRCERAAAATSLLFVAAVTVMIAQP